MMCSVLALNAQDIKFELKKTGIFKDEEKLSGIMGVSDDGKGGVIMARWYNAYHGKKHGYLLEHYNDKMIKVKSQKFVLEKKKEHIIGAVLNKNIVNLIEFTYDKKQQAYICYSHWADAADFKIQKKELFRLNMKREKVPMIFLNVDEIKNLDYIHADFFYNNDKSAFAISVNVNTGKKKGEVHEIYVFNNNLDLIAKNTLKKDFKYNAYKIEDIGVAQDGSAAYVLGKVRIDRKKRKKNGPEYYYDLTRLTNTETSSETLDTEQYSVEFLKLAVSKNVVACLGLFNTREKDFGISYFDIDPLTAKLKNNKFLSFSEGFSKQYSQIGMKNFTFSSLLLTEDDSFIFNAEEIEINSIPSSSGGMKLDYTYKDILAAKITDDGNLAWVRKVNKFQYTRGAANSFLSYSSMISGNDAYYFMNGNLSGSDGKYAVNCKGIGGTDLNVVKIDADGVVNAKKVLDESQIKVPFNTPEGVTIPGSSSMFFVGREYKNKQLIRINL